MTIEELEKILPSFGLEADLYAKLGEYGGRPYILNIGPKDERVRFLSSRASRFCVVKQRLKNIGTFKEHLQSVRTVVVTSAGSIWTKRGGLNRDVCQTFIDAGMEVNRYIAN